MEGEAIADVTVFELMSYTRNCASAKTLAAGQPNDNTLLFYDKTTSLTHTIELVDNKSYITEFSNACGGTSDPCSSGYVYAYRPMINQVLSAQNESKFSPSVTSAQQN